MLNSMSNQKALLIVDMQAAYFNNDALQQAQESLVNNCNRLIQYARDQAIPIFNIRTVHKHDTSSWTLNMLDDTQGYLFEDEPDSANIEGLDTAGTTVMLKTRDSAFYATDLESSLRTLGVTNLIVCGVSTHTCVFLTATDAYARNFRVTLVQDAIATHDPNFHDSTFDFLKSEYRQSVIRIADLVAQ